MIKSPCAQQPELDYQNLFLNDTPLIDLRAPAEFAKGSFPTAYNLPLMFNEEREKVGICYKRNGKEQAIQLGHQLVSGATKSARVEKWQRFAQSNPQGFLFCFRGGLRSQIAQQWLTECGIQYPIVHGGYKSLRNYLINQLEIISQQQPLIMLSGYTGIGKTRLLKKFTLSLDLEQIANHKGSSFGRATTPQPTQIDFENLLAVNLLKLFQHNYPFLLVEDEAKLIGACAIPLSFHRAMRSAPIILLNCPFEERVENIYREYVALKLSANYSGEDQVLAIKQRLNQALKGIKKRLGNRHYFDIQKTLSAAFATKSHKTSVELHKCWIAKLLKDYYDPMYRYQLSQKESRVIFNGDQQAVVTFIENESLSF